MKTQTRFGLFTVAVLAAAAFFNPLNSAAHADEMAGYKPPVVEKYVAPVVKHSAKVVKIAATPISYRGFKCDRWIPDLYEPYGCSYFGDAPTNGKDHDYGGSDDGDSCESGHHGKDGKKGKHGHGGKKGHGKHAGKHGKDGKHGGYGRGNGKGKHGSHSGRGKGKGKSASKGHGKGSRGRS